MIHKRTHPTYRSGCKPCKWASLSFFDVPGGHRYQNSDRVGKTQMEKDLHRYRDKKQAGERPRSIRSAGVNGMDKGDKLQDTWSVNEKQIKDNNSPEQVKVIKETLTNQKE